MKSMFKTVEIKNTFRDFFFLLCLTLILTFPFLSLAAENLVSRNMDLPLLGEVDLTQLSLPGLSIILGLIDGLNVCSIGALILVLSIVLIFKKRSVILLLGGLFLLVVTLTYGILVFIWYQIFIFLLPYFFYMRLLIGTIALIGGIYFLKEFLRLKRVGFACKIGENKLMKKVTENLQKSFQSPKKNILALVLAVIFFALIATIVEFPCSAAIPLVFTGILATANLSISEYLFYIFLYLFFYLLDELVIFMIAVFTKQIWLKNSKFVAYGALAGSLVLFYLAYYYYFGTA